MKELTWAEALQDAGDFRSHHIESNQDSVSVDHVAVFDYTKAVIRLQHKHGRMVLTLIKK